MTDDRALQRRLDALERTVRRQRLGLGAFALALGVAALASWRTSDPEVLRAQRFVALDDRGIEIGDFGFQRVGETRVIGWHLDDPASGALALCVVGSDFEEGSPADKGYAAFQLEAGWAISQHSVRELTRTINHSYIIGEDEKTAARLTANESTSELVLSPLPRGDILSEESDDSHALRLSYDAAGPRITGVDLEGTSKIDIR